MSVMDTFCILSSGGSQGKETEETSIFQREVKFHRQNRHAATQLSSEHL